MSNDRRLLVGAGHNDYAIPCQLLLLPFQISPATTTLCTRFPSGHRLQFRSRTTTTSAFRATYHPIQQTFRPFSFTMATKEAVHNVKAKADFDVLVADKDKLSVIDCYATWCGPCKVIAPQVSKLADEFNNATFYKLDVDELPDVAQELGVRAMPTFYLFKNGEKVKEVVGANLNALRAAIQEHY
ncbi:hypothetical protein BST61_g11269 [Cercospora zeina]